MGILIDRNGQQSGPYSLEDVRAMVLSGQLSATDWAWPDGATAWVALKDVPGFAAPAAPNMGRPPAPPDPVNQETELWSGHPSQLLNLKAYFLWSIALPATFVLGMEWREIFYAFIVLLPLCLVHLLHGYLHVRSVKYVITTQRVRIIRGILSRDIQEIELFRVEDTTAHQTLFLRLFGLGNITILSGDQRNPTLSLTAIPGAVQLRERLRQEVMNLRQRLGVRPLDVIQTRQ
jgi:membrane protein YdbS with pleckstrin-like domain